MTVGIPGPLALEFFFWSDEDVGSLEEYLSGFDNRDASEESLAVLSMDDRLELLAMDDDDS